MKKLIAILALVVVSVGAFAQENLPQQMNENKVMTESQCCEMKDMKNG